MKEQIPAIQIPVPEEYGDAYDGEEGRQWVLRKQRIGRKWLKELDGLAEKVSDDKAFKAICGALSEIILDWNLEGDEGPLPKPHKNSKAFQALYDSDFAVAMWVAQLPFFSIARLTEQMQEKN